MRNCTKLSIVVPVYYNQDTLRPLYEDIKNKFIDMVDFDYELVLVDDGSGDGSWQVMQQLAARDAHIRTIRLSRNFGSHAAILCGLSHAAGDCAVVKAADLQEPTDILREMVDSWKSGNNVVLAVRSEREDKSLFSKLYYWLVQKMALPQMPKGGFDTFLLDRKVIDVLEKMDEPNTAITGQILWSGFRTGQVYYARKAREIGKSRWTLKKKLRLVTNTMFSFSNLPIGIITGIGSLSFAGAIIWGAFVLVNKLMGNIVVDGWTTSFIFDLFSFGIIMLSIGILGSYLWRIFDTTRHRPPYIVEDGDKGADA